MIRPRSKPRPGRLKGEDLVNLRKVCWVRDRGLCQRCGQATYPNLPEMDDHSFHMAHKRNKRMWGDNLDNVQTECGDCHRAYHRNGPSMEKPCKEKQ